MEKGAISILFKIGHNWHVYSVPWGQSYRSGNLLTLWRTSRSQSYVTTDGQPSWCQADIWDLKLHFFSCLTVAGLLTGSALSDERRVYILQCTIYLHVTIWIYQMFRAQADWTLTHTSHKDIEQSTKESSITPDSVTLTDSLIRLITEWLNFSLSGDTSVCR
jgi:hypothetical protein